MTTTPSVPPSSTEDRLRATLAAEADRHPVAPDLEGLRARRNGSDRALVDLRLSPRRNRARILAAAVVLAVLAAGATAVVRSGPGEDRDPVTSGAGASGYYLPGEGWEIVSVDVASVLDQGTVREAYFVDDPGPDEVPQISALVLRATSVEEAIPHWESDGAVPVDRGSADPRTWLVADEGTGEDDQPVVSRQLVVPGDGEVLSLGTTGGELDALLEVADRWVASDGRDLGVAPATGLTRGLDITYASPTPVDVGTLFSIDRPPVAPAAVPLVVVTVRSPGGAMVQYTLAVPDTVGRPTGVGDADRGTGAGLLPDELPERDEDLRDDGEVWWTDGTTPVGSALALLPGADVGVSLSDIEIDVDAEEGSDAGAYTTTEDLRDVMAGLRLVDGDTWAEAVRSAEGGDRPWPARLAEVEPAEPEQTETTFVAVGDPLAGTSDGPTDTTVPAAETTEAEGTDTTAPSTVLPGAPDPAFATGPLGELADPDPDPDWLADSFADELTIGLVGTTDGDVVLTGADRLDPARWVLEVDAWERQGPVALLELYSAGRVSASTPGSPQPRCSADSDPVESDLVTITPETVESCIDWFGLVVRIGDQERIAEVRLALASP